MIDIVEALDGSVLDGAIHPSDLTVCPRMFPLGCAMFSVVLPAGPPQDIFHVGEILLSVRKLGTVVSDYGAHQIGDSGGEWAQEPHGDQLGGAMLQPNESQFRCAVDGDQHLEFAVGGLHFGDIAMELADRAAREPLLCRPHGGGLCCSRLGSDRQISAERCALARYRAQSHSSSGGCVCSWKATACLFPNRNYRRLWIFRTGPRISYRLPPFPMY